MTLTIGRFGIDVSTNGPSKFSQSGDILRIAGPMRVTSVANMKTLRQQLVGYIDNPWEPVVPVTWSTDSTVDGYYRVLDVSVDVPTFGYKNGFASFDCTLERVRGYSSSLVESIMSGAARTGTPGGVTPSTWWGVSSLATYLGINGLAPGAGDTVTGPDGSVRVYSDATAFYSSRPQVYLSPANFYNMSARIKVDGVTVTGRQIPLWTSSVEIGNGLVRLELTGSGVKIYTPIRATPGTEGTGITLAYGYYDGSFNSTIGNLPSILRNSPEECVIRFTTQYHPGITSSYRVDTDIGLRRGSSMFTMTFNSTSSQAWGIDGPATNTSITGGFAGTAADANGNKFVAVSAQTVTKDTANGLLYLTTPGTFHDMSVGFEIDTDITTTELRDMYYAAITETARVRLQ